ncbi:MAG: GNAT family N-acetyltransferase [Actinobacteria bacterium]|jgi:2'-5' RNA ligase|nr:GNAT family N-acetyltransferase [Actinomycetota bacterium]
MKRHRIGIVHTFSGEPKAMLEGLRIGLGGFGVGRICPHITLLPPTNIHPSSMAGEIYRLRAIASETDPYQVTIGPAATFHPVSPVLYLSVEENDGNSMANLVTRLARSELYKPSSRPYVPHVTLSDGVDFARIVAATQVLDSELFTFSFSSFEMMLSGSQAYWEIYSDFRFAKCRKVFRGGLELEVFSHQSGDLAIYSLASDLDIHQSCFWPYPDRRFRIDGQRFISISVYNRGNLVAAGSGCYSSVFALIRSVVVKSEFQKIGLGSLIVGELLYALQLTGAEMVYAITEHANENFLLGLGAEKLFIWPPFLVQEKGTTLNSWSFSSR